MTSEQIEAFRTRIAPYLEREEDKIELAVICRCAAAYMEHVEATTDSLLKSNVEKYMQ